MTNMEVAQLIGQPKGVESMRLISPGKEILQLTSGIIEANFPSKKKEKDFSKKKKSYVTPVNENNEKKK